MLLLSLMKRHVAVRNEGAPGGGGKDDSNVSLGRDATGGTDTMFKRILACSDGSECAQRALRVTAEMAKRFGSEVVVINAFNPSYANPGYMGAWAMAIDTETVKRCAKEQWEEVEAGAMPIFQQAGVSCRFMPLSGHPVDSLVVAAQDEKADVIVVGSRGMTEWKSLLLGSVSTGVLHHAHCPVLIVRGENPTIHKILLATDGSDTAAKAARAAGELTQKLHADLTVLNVFEPFRDYPNLTHDDLEPEHLAARVLDTVAGRVGQVLDANGIAYTLHQQSGRPAETIVHVACACNSDLIVVGSRGLGTFKAMLLGSVSNSLAHHAPCSLLVVR